MKKTLKVVASYLLVALVALTVATSYQLFVFPNRFAPAGLNGVFTMLQHTMNVKLSYTTVLVNVPLAIAAYFYLSKARALRSLTYTVLFSVFLAVLDHVDLSFLAYSTPSSTILGPLVAGIISGACGYVMHKLGAGYGGTEFIAGFIHKKNPQANLFTVIFLLNVSVAAISFFVYDYKIEPVLLCVIYSYASSTVRDILNRRYKSAIRCEIVTDDPEGLKEAIIQQLHRSATQIQATGAYTGQEKTVLVCIINSSQVAELTKLVAQFPNSFAVMGSVNNVVGNFKRLDSHGQQEREFFDGGETKEKV